MPSVPLARIWIVVLALVAMALPLATKAQEREPMALRLLIHSDAGSSIPGSNRGALVYLHGTRTAEDTADVIPMGYSAFARRMKLDQFVITRSKDFDTVENDDRVVAFITQQLDQLAKDGYGSIYLSGHSRGAWLAAVAATASTHISGLLISAPGNTSLRADELLRQRDRLAALLSVTKAQRVFVVFFSGDPREAVPGGRGLAIRAALDQAKVPFVVLDRPPDLVGHFAISLGRFVRRYSDCLEEFFGAKRLPAGAFSCKEKGGYASGAEIDFPPIESSGPSQIDPSAKLKPFLGRWQGDSPEGAYVILASTTVGEDNVVFVLGYSPTPSGMGSPWIREFKFNQSIDGQSMVHTYVTGESTFGLRLINADEAVLEVRRNRGQPPMHFQLRRQSTAN